MVMTCNAAENECSPDTVEEGTAKCNVVGETCQEETGEKLVCKCGAGKDPVSSCAGTEKPICDIDNSRCVECKDKSDCKDDVKTACDTEKGECVGKQVIIKYIVHIDNIQFIMDKY